MATPCSHQGVKVLLVKGKDDCHVILALCQHFNIPENFGIFQCENDIGVLKRADALILQAGMECIGIVLDADDKSPSDHRWTQIREIIDDIGYVMPDIPDSAGTILKSPGKPKLGIWIMPDNTAQGRLEDFLMAMVPSEALEQARQCVAIALQRQLTTFKEVHLSKAHLHTYLAWQDEPGTPLGLSITKYALNPDTTTAGHFARWLVRLFD